MGPIVCVAVVAHHTNLLIMKGNFRSLSQIKTAPVPIFLCIGVHTQMEQSFIGKKLKYWVKNTVMYCLDKKTVTKISFFPCSHLQFC
jgi:hypothetical protein